MNNNQRGYCHAMGERVQMSDTVPTSIPLHTQSRTFGLPLQASSAYAACCVLADVVACPHWDFFNPEHNQIWR